jgi:hypothetical protein
MIFSENRFPLFGIMRPEAQKARFPAPGAAEYRSEARGVNPNGRFALAFGLLRQEEA